MTPQLTMDQLSRIFACHRTDPFLTSAFIIFLSFVVDEMSSRIDDLEKSIGELVQNVEEEPKLPPAPADK